MSLHSSKPSVESDAIELQAIGLTKRFGNLRALNDVSLHITSGSFHALLGENGAGKSTLVKCIMGFYTPDAGELLIDNKQEYVQNPKVAQSLGLGMVYQHFTLVPSLTAAENLTISKRSCPAVIHWRDENAALRSFLDSTPFDIPLNTPVRQLAAGQKQKLEIIKQLYLGCRFLILDEPTSVLTPDEASELLSLVKSLCGEDRLTALMITHKFKEVMQFADHVSILRRGCYAGGGLVSELSQQDMAEQMMGPGSTVGMPTLCKPTNKPTNKPTSDPTGSADNESTTVLSMQGIVASDARGYGQITIDELTVAAGEVVGIAGVSGNGQSELMEILTGQRALLKGTIDVMGRRYKATRQESQSLKVRYLPEEPLHNACAGNLSVAQNLALRSYDTQQNGTPRRWLSYSTIRSLATRLVEEYDIKTVSLDTPIFMLSGGNIQRTVLARELTGDINLLIVANPCFGLDFSSVTAIRQRLLAARQSGTAILLISEDLDEIMTMADRLFVMADGRITYGCSRDQADVATIGRYMAGHQSEDVV